MSWIKRKATDGLESYSKKPKQHFGDVAYSGKTIVNSILEKDVYNQVDNSAGATSVNGPRRLAALSPFFQQRSRLRTTASGADIDVDIAEKIARARTAVNEHVNPDETPLGQMREKLRMTESEKSGLEDVGAGLSKNLKTAQDNEKKAREELSKVKSESVAEVKEANDLKNSAWNREQKALNEVKSSKEGNEKIVKSLKEENKNINDDNARLRTKCKKLKDESQVKQKNEEIARLNKEVAELKQKDQASAKEMMRLEKENARLITEANERLNTQHTAWQKRVEQNSDKAEKDANTAAATISSLQKELEESKQAKAKSKSDLEACKKQRYHYYEKSVKYKGMVVDMGGEVSDDEDDKPAPSKNLQEANGDERTAGEADLVDEVGEHETFDDDEQESETEEGDPNHDNGDDPSAMTSESDDNVESDEYDEQGSEAKGDDLNDPDGDGPSTNDSDSSEGIDENENDDLESETDGNDLTPNVEDGVGATTTGSSNGDNNNATTEQNGSAGRNDLGAGNDDDGNASTTSTQVDFKLGRSHSRYDANGKDWGRDSGFGSSISSSAGVSFLGAAGMGGGCTQASAPINRRIARLGAVTLFCGGSSTHGGSEGGCNVGLQTVAGAGPSVSDPLPDMQPEYDDNIPYDRDGDIEMDLPPNDSGDLLRAGRQSSGITPQGLDGILNQGRPNGGRNNNAASRQRAPAPSPKMNIDDGSRTPRVIGPPPTGPRRSRAGVVTGGDRPRPQRGPQDRPQNRSVVPNGPSRHGRAAGSRESRSSRPNAGDWRGQSRPEGRSDNLRFHGNGGIGRPDRNNSRGGQRGGVSSQQRRSEQRGHGQGGHIRREQQQGHNGSARLSGDPYQTERAAQAARRAAADSGRKIGGRGGRR